MRTSGAAQAVLEDERAAGSGRSAQPGALRPPTRLTDRDGGQPSGGVEATRKLAISADPAELPAAREFFDAAAADVGFDELMRYQITTAANEAVSNAIRHGAPFADGVNHLSVTAKDGELVCSVHDAGRFEHVVRGAPDAVAEHGRGFPLMRILMDEVVLDTASGGTIVRLSKRLEASAAPAA
jgi:anti-sigma regulatory factor (Ser/Thr protein kinase)